MGQARAAKEHTSSYGGRDGLEGFLEEEMLAAKLKGMGLLEWAYLTR